MVRSNSRSYRVDPATFTDNVHPDEQDEVCIKNRKHAVNETLSIHLATEFTRCTPDYMKKSSLLTAGLWHIAGLWQGTWCTCSSSQS